MPSVLVSNPSGYPVTLQQAKDHLRVSGTSEDALILNLIKTSTAQVENDTRRKLYAQAWNLFLDLFEDIELPFGQLQSVTHVKYYDTDNVQQTLATSVYDVDSSSDPGKILLANNQSWPSIYDRANAIEIQFICGYSSIPPSLIHAVKLKIEELYGGHYPKELEGIKAAYKSLIFPYKLAKF